MRIGFVACAKEKRDGRHAAKDLYASPLFRLAFAFASAHCQRVLILSAKHGLLAAGTRVRAYDLSLRDLSAWEKSRWDARVVRQIRRTIARGDELYFFAGRLYRDQLVAELRMEHQCHAPLAGLAIGEQLAWYKRNAPC